MARRFPSDASFRFSILAVGLLALAARPSTAGMSQDGEPPLPPPQVQGASAILVDASTGTVLWEKACHARRPIASTTKIMTATLLLERANMDDWVTFSEKARLTPYANLNVKPGERFRMRDLLYAIMLRSSNDGCVAVAEHMAGSVPRFAQEMTARAKALGCTDTNFVTPNGLYDPNHFSSAFDLAVMARHAIQNPLFNEVVATKSTAIDRTINTKDTVIKNHNKFLEKYDGADGIKTGYVRQSGKCLVASATRPEGTAPWRLITVVLNSPDIYGDSARLMDWGRKYFQPVFFARRGEQVTLASVRGGSEPQVPLLAADDLFAIVRRHPGKNPEREIRAPGWLSAPVRATQVGGQLVAMVDGRPVGEVDLVPARPVSQIWTAGVAPWTGGSMLFAAVVLGPRYARTITKNHRRRRRRLQARRRRPDLERESLG